MPRLEMVQIDTIKVDERARKDYGDMEAFIASIKDKGILQPITISEEYHLLAGGRRLDAAGKAGLTEIPVLVHPITDDIDAMEIELIENIMRKDFTWVERSQLTKKIFEHEQGKDRDWSQRDTAKILGMSLGKVNKHIKIAEYVEAVPELKELKNENDVLKAIDKMEEAVVIKELQKRNKEAAPEGATNWVRIADSNYKIGDTLTGLAMLQDVPIGFIECDPPYGIDLQNTKKKEGEVNTELDAYNEVDNDEYENFLGKLTYGLYKAAGDHCWMVFWFGPTWHTEVKRALVDAGWQVNDIPGIWNKGQGQTMQPNTNLASTYEPFFICRKGQPILRKPGRANVFTFPPLHGTKKYHPTQRPAELIDEILETFAYPNGIVLVPFLGSGQTLLSAYKADMKGFGWDLEESYKDRFLLEVTKMEK